MDNENRTNAIPLERPSFAIVDSDGDVTLLLAMPAHSAVTPPVKTQCDDECVCEVRRET